MKHRHKLIVVFGYFGEASKLIKDQVGVRGAQTLCYWKSLKWIADLLEIVLIMLMILSLASLS